MVTGAGTRVDRRLAASFADLLEYPSVSPAEAARACEALLRQRSAEAAAAVVPLRELAEESTLGELQEAYTAAFDLDSLSDVEPTCYPYVGHHLFDENHKRSAFLVGLAARYREHGFELERELPDHLAAMLRFVASCPDEALARELLDEAVVPAVARMARAAGAEARTGRERYLLALRALESALSAGGEPA